MTYNKIEWGPKIAVDGKQPDWLGNDEILRVYRSVDLGRCTWEVLQVDWPSITEIRLPAYHWAYPVIEKGFTPWGGGADAPVDWTALEADVLYRDGKRQQGRQANSWRHNDLPWDIIGYRKKGAAMNTNGTSSDFVGFLPNTPSPEWWIAQGRALQAEGKLPAGVVLPEPEIDYERYRTALEAFYRGRYPEPVWKASQSALDDIDKTYIRALIAAMPHMPKD